MSKRTSHPVIEGAEELGWDPTRPSDDVQDLTARFAARVNEVRVLTEDDRVGIVSNLVVLRLKVVFGKLGKDQRLVLHIALAHALRALGYGSQDGGVWELPHDEHEEWVGRIATWADRWRESTAGQEDAKDSDAGEDVEPALTLNRLATAFGYLGDPEDDVQVMRSALQRTYPDSDDIGGGATVTLDDMPELFDLVRRTSKGKERRLMFPKDGTLHLGREEVERGLNALFKVDDSPSTLSINAPIEGTEEQGDPAADEDFDPIQRLILWRSSRRALEALEELRESAIPDSATAIVLDPGNLSFLSRGGSIADLARRTNRPEATLRQARDRVVEEVGRRLGSTG